MRELIKRYGYVPTHCVWELTMACNMRCKHCGSAAGLERPRELTTEEALRVCDELAALGNRQLTISGGEPFLRRDWDQLVRRLTDHGIRVNAVSNGLALHERTVRRALDAGLKNVGISLDGLRDTHNDIRSTPTAFDGVMRAWETCAKVGLPVSAVTCIFRWNLHELEEIYQLLVANGIKQWQIQLAEPMGNMEAYLEGLIDVEAVPGILDLYNRVMREGKVRAYLADCLGYYSPQEFEHPRFGKGKAVSFWTGCYAGCRVVGIRSNGDVTGCLSIRDDRFIEGNLLETSLTEIWNRKTAFSYNRAFTENDLGGACKTCSYGRICRGGCTSMSVTLTGKAHADPWCYQALREKQLSQQALTDASVQPAGSPLPLAPAALPTRGRPAACLAAAWPG